MTIIFEGTFVPTCSNFYVLICVVSVHVAIIHPCVIKYRVFISRVYAWSLINFTNFEYSFLTGEMQRRKNHIECRGRKSAEPDIKQWGCARGKDGRQICTGLFRFRLSVSFHRSSTHVHSSINHAVQCSSPSTSVFPCQYHSTIAPYSSSSSTCCPYQKGRDVGPVNLSKTNALSEHWHHWLEKYFHFFCNGWMWVIFTRIWPKNPGTSHHILCTKDYSLLN